MDIISIRNNPEYLDQAIAYFQDKWATDDSMAVYDDCMRHCIDAATAITLGENGPEYINIH